MNVGDVWRLRCDPSYHVRIESVTPKKVRYVVCNRFGQQTRGTGGVHEIRTPTFLNAYEHVGNPTSKGEAP